MTKVLVTGGAGFIGSNFVHQLSIENDFKITVVDALTYAGSMSNLNALIQSNKVEFFHGDIADQELMAKLVKSNDVIINFAAESHVDNSILSPDSFVKTNIVGTMVLLNQVREFNKRLIQISTDEVYGSLDYGYADEEFALKTNSPYSASKASADLLCLAYFKTYGIDVSITRCSNNYGIRQNSEKFIPMAILSFLNARKVPVYGSGENIRNWIHVNDHVDGILAVVKNGKSGQIYNFGSNESFTNLQVLNLIASRLNVKYDYIKFVEDRKGHDFRYAIEFSKASKELGWKPERVFLDKIDSIITWYKKN
jgi:dTDP-glucose 4,6-dehydratase